MSILSLAELRNFSMIAINEDAAKAGKVAESRKPASSREFLWYLATPYTHKDTAVLDERARLATMMAAELIEGGLNVFSPIAAHHPASLHMMKPERVTHADWMGICYSVMDRCDGLIVSTMAGWWESKGVQLEIQRWKSLKTMRRALYASPITADGVWFPTFAWKPDQVGAK